MNAEVSLEVRSLMSRFRSGDRTAADALMNHFYPELRRIASYRMQAERAEHTWTPTVLVNELYLELVKIKALRPGDENSSEREAFLKLAAHIMRRLLIHRSRPQHNKMLKVDLNVLDLSDHAGTQSGVEALSELEDLLERLRQLDPRLRTVVELRVFEGKTVDETAETMGCSPRTIHKYWNFARHWLASELGEKPDDGSPVPG